MPIVSIFKALAGFKNPVLVCVLGGSSLISHNSLELVRSGPPLMWVGVLMMLVMTAFIVATGYFWVYATIYLLANEQQREFEENAQPILEDHEKKKRRSRSRGGRGPANQ